MSKVNKVINIRDRQSQTAMLELAGNDENVRFQGAREIIPSFGIIQNEAWISQLELNERGAYKPTLENITLILKNDHRLKGVIAHNDFREDLVRKADTPWCDCEDPVNGDPWRNEDDVQVKKLLEVTYGLSPQVTKFSDAVSLAGYNNRFHPIEDYLNSLEWDGKPRLESLLTRYLGVVDNAYTRAVSRKTLCAAVARVFKPGIKFDHVLILEGKQGKGKSTFIKTLGKHWFGDNISSFKGKDAVEGMQGVWIMELSELQAFGKAEIEHVKSFISRTEDRMRPAYAHRVETFKRRCIFVGTTNDTEYLKDETGNRRFWPVHCEIEKIDIPALKKEVDQLWAEAVVLWRKGEKLYLDKKEQEAIAQKEQSSRYAEDPWTDRIKLWLEEPVSKVKELGSEMDFEFEEGVKRDRVTIEEVLVECLGIEVDKIKPAESNRVRRIIKGVDGWSDTSKNMKFGNDGGQRKCHYRV
jgi:putative DNA primase/helicase